MTPTLADAIATLQSRFGYPAFRSGQEEAVSSVLAGGDTLVVMPTGGGKSLCYQVPALLLPKLTVVVSPLISLMKDQVDALTARGLPATFLNSTLSSSEIAERIARAQRGEVKLLYVAPERFDAGSAADRLRNIGISLLAVDEAHCISEWGHDFRPSYRRMARVREQLGSPPTIALTATATAEVRRDIVRQLGLRDPRVIVTGFDRKNLNYHVRSVKNPGEKDAALVDALKEYPGLAVVYASTRKDVERVAGVLERAKVRAVAYHAGLDPRLRQEVQDAFMTERVRAIVATNAFGMGIDKANVRLVVHHSMPGSLEAYYQEAGRAGRDGAQAECVLLHSFPDRFTHEFFLKCSNPERPLIEELYSKMREKADPDGSVRYTAERLAGMLDDKSNDREVEAALRVLVRHGVVIDEQETSLRVTIRMLATPERIKRELPDGLELGLLRALWRLHGDRLYDGVSVDPAGLPPGFSGVAGTVPLLDALQERHFLSWNRTGGGLRLADPRLQTKELTVDWQLLERRRKAELSKLEMMQKYAYTPGCRRDFVLKYFGDPAARGKCEGCDNCLGTHVKAKSGPKVAERRPRVRGERGKSGSGTRDRSRAPKAPPDALEPRDVPLFTALKRLRASIAAADKVPAYVICPDRTLAEIAARRPRSSGTLAGISGLGPVRIEKYGDRIIEIVRNVSDTEAA